MDKFMKDLEKNWKYLTLLASVLVTLLGGFWKVGTWFNDQNKLLESTTKLAQKSIIWNRDIPKVERAEVCDAYLSKGYDSYTRKLCENYILSEVDSNERNTTENIQTN